MIQHSERREAIMYESALDDRHHWDEAQEERPHVLTFLILALVHH